MAISFSQSAGLSGASEDSVIVGGARPAEALPCSGTCQRYPASATPPALRWVAV